VKKSSKKGFTIVEVVIALAIFSIGVMGVYGLAAWLIQANDFSNRMTAATSIAQGRLEDIQNQSFPLMASGSETTADNYTVTWTVTSINATLKSILVVVTWTDIKGKTHKVELRTMSDS